MACCNDIDLCAPAYDAGCFDPCEVLLFPTLAASTGTFKLVTHFNGEKVTITDDQIDGESIAFLLVGMNEHYTFVAQVYDETNTLVEIEGKEWVKFSTKKHYQLA